MVIALSISLTALGGWGLETKGHKFDDVDGKFEESVKVLDLFYSTWIKLRGSAVRGDLWSAIVRAYTNESYAACAASIFSSKPFSILRHMNSL